jgi:hypothetical protein
MTNWPVSYSALGVCRSVVAWGPRSRQSVVTELGTPKRQTSLHATVRKQASSLTAIPPISIICASELYRLSDRRLSAKLVPTVADRGRHVVSVTDTYGRIFCFLDLFFQVAHQLYSPGWMDPLPDPLLFRKSVTAGNRTQTSGSVATTQHI